MMKKTNETQVSAIAKAKIYVAERAAKAKNSSDIEFLNNVLTALETQEAELLALRKDFEDFKAQIQPTQFIDINGNHDIHGKIL